MLGVVDHLPDNVDFLIGNDLDAGSRIESVNVVVRLQAKKLLRVDQIDDVTGDVKKDIELSLIRVMKLQICVMRLVILMIHCLYLIYFLTMLCQKDGM